jgi:hypothetical protein
MKNNAAAGSWQRAGITEPPTYHSAGTPALEPGNDSGFWLQGSTDNSAFAATLTVRVNVDLTGFDPQFNWCAYASDRPPHAAPVDGGYTLNGTPPFIIQTQRNNSGSTASISSSTYHNCIYGLTDATGAPGVVSPVPEITGFTASATTLCVGQSATLTATLAAAGSFIYSFNNGVTWVSSPTTVVTPAASTTYILKAKLTAGGCTVTAPSPIEITVHPMPDVAFVNPPAKLCTNASATLTVNDVNSAGGSYCFTYQCNGCVHNPYTCGNDSAAAAGCDWFSECVYGEANTYSMTMYDAGSMTVWVKAKTEYGCADSAYTVITQTEPPTITFISGSDNQKVKAGAAIAQIKYATANASGATVTGLPDGVSGAWAADTYTISGTPSTTTTGAFIYTVTTTNSYGCVDASVAGTITVYPPGCAPSNLTLGEIGFASTQTYSRNGITISAPVTVTYCQKTTYNGSNGTLYYADCRNNPGYEGDLMSYCMAAEYSAVLCPYPWKLPDVPAWRAWLASDPLDGGTGPLTSAVLGWDLSGLANAAGVLQNQGTHHAAWSGSASGHPTIPFQWVMDCGNTYAQTSVGYIIEVAAVLRCVK